jgi:protein involved in polysaccharide export with SLBB domain
MRAFLLLAALFGASTAAAAQTTELFSTGPRGVTELPPMLRSTPAPAAAPVTLIAAPPAAAPLPPNPATATQPVVFGSQMFSGRFASEQGGGFNPEYRVTVGDRIALRVWGAYNHDAVQPVDAQGNIFVPNVGPVQVLGVRNADLNTHVVAQTRRVYRGNVEIYATVDAAQPVKVYVTGFVRAPGLYGGLSSSSVLTYLDRAGGIDPDRGSHLEVSVRRGGQERARIDLYRFLLDGRIDQVQLQDGDSIVVGPRRHLLRVGGEVHNPYAFEFATPQVAATELLALARPRPGATHLSIVRKLGAERRSEYVPLESAAGVQLFDGDEVTVTSDRYPGTILVKVDGAHVGERQLVLPYGARLADALARVKPAPQSRLDALQLFRPSLAVRQKEMLEASLRGLETYALTARSATSEEAALRTREAELILRFVERARSVEPVGRVVLAGRTQAGDTLLENGDTLFIPERSNLVSINGEVLFPTSLVWEPGAGVDAYVREAGGYNQGAERARVLVQRIDGSVFEPGPAALAAGDQVLVLPRIETKNVEITRGISQIVYQIAVAAKVLFGL